MSADFGSGHPLDLRIGLQVRYNNVDPWVKLSNRTTQGLATGDLDRVTAEDLVADFGGGGLWVRYGPPMSASWTTGRRPRS